MGDGGAQLPGGNAAQPLILASFPGVSGAATEPDIRDIPGGRTAPCAFSAGVSITRTMIAETLRTYIRYFISARENVSPIGELPGVCCALYAGFMLILAERPTALPGGAQGAGVHCDHL